MKIKLDERYYIEPIQYGYALMDSEGRTTKNKETEKLEFVADPVGYFGNVAQATERYIRIIVDHPNKVVTMREYVQAYKEVYERVVGILPKLKGK